MMPLPLAQAAFYGIGAYAYAMLSSNQFDIHLPSIVSIPRRKITRPMSRRPASSCALVFSPTTAAHVREEFGAEVAGVLDGGPCAVGIESTIVDCTRGAPVLLRPGQITRVQIEQVCGQPLQDPAAIAAPAPKASGIISPTSRAASTGRSGRS